MRDIDSHDPMWTTPGVGTMSGDAIRFSLYFIAFYFTLGVLLPFWPVWLLSKGLDAAQIGMIMAAVTAGRIITAPLIGGLADQFGRRRQILSLLALCTLLIFFGFGQVDGFGALLWLSLPFAMAWTGMGPLGENTAALGLKQRGLDYGRVRLWGSFAFIAGTLGMAQWLTPAGDGWIHPVIVAGLGLVLLACLGLPEVAVTPGRRRGSSLVAPLRQLPAVPGLVTFFIAGGLIQASHGFYYGFGTLHWRAVGFSDQWIGWLWAVGVLAEIALFTLAGRFLGRVGHWDLLILAALGAVLRWLVIGRLHDGTALVLVQCLHGLSFGLCHLAAMHYMVHKVPVPLTATAQAVNAALSGGVLMGVSMLVSGPLFARHGGDGYWAMAAMAGIGLLASLAARRSRDPQRSRDP